MLYISSCEPHLNDRYIKRYLQLSPKSKKNVFAWRFMQLCLQFFFKQGLLPVTHFSTLCVCARTHREIMVQQPHTMIQESFALAFRMKYMTFPWWLSDEEPAYNEGDAGLIPGSGRSPGEGNLKPFQYS